MHRQAARAQMESDDVDAESERSTGDNAKRARNSRMDDFMTFAPENCQQNASYSEVEVGTY